MAFLMPMGDLGASVAAGLPPSTHPGAPNRSQRCAELPTPEDAKQLVKVEPNLIEGFYVVEHSGSAAASRPPPRFAVFRSDARLSCVLHARGAQVKPFPFKRGEPLEHLVPPREGSVRHPERAACGRYPDAEALVANCRLASPNRYRCRVCKARCDAVWDTVAAWRILHVCRECLPRRPGCSARRVWR
jgi:hypothetical protein